MSLILEALRRSEAERQRGRAPGLFVEQQALRRGQRPLPPWAFPAAGGLLLLVLAAWGWREFARDDAGAGVSPPPAAVGGSAAPGTDRPAPDAGAMPAPADAGAWPAGDPARVADAPVVEPEPVVTVDTSPPAPTPSAPAAASPAAGANVAAPTARAPDVAASPAAASPAAVSPPVAVVPAEEALPRLADLPAGERGALPPLKLSMHVYSDDPARRFVIVDGQRLTEGAAPAAGVVVEQIRRDGAVLSLNGRRVLLGRP